MIRAMTKRLIHLPATFSLLFTGMLNNRVSRHTHLVLLIFLLAATWKPVDGIPSSPVSATAPATDTVRIDTIRSEAIDATAGIAFWNKQAIILSNAKFQQKMIPGLVSFGEDGTYLADPQALDRTPKKMLAANDPFAHAPVGMAIATRANVLYYTAPGNGNRAKDKIYALPVEKAPSGEKIALSPVYADMLPFCEGDDAYRHPAVDGNNTFLVFASDRRGTMGGFDLFLVQKEGAGWGRPVHLGNEINSVEDELYPFIDNQNNLFFSSEGHSGFGGLDLYMSRYTGDGWERPINLMKLINSAGDDFGLKIDATNNTGFITSVDNRGNRQGHMYRLRPNRQGQLSGELLDNALTAFEEMFGVAFTSTADQKMTIPQAVEMREVQAEKTKPVEEQKAEEQKAEKEIKEVSTSDPRPQEFVAARKEPAQPVVQKEQKPTVPVEEKVAEEKPLEEPQAEEKDAVIFRVQITSTRSSVAGKKETIGGKSYTVFEYYYKGAYRQAVGAFRELSEASAFQSKCRSAGFSQAFVAAFINNERVTDPAVFRN
jgi:hypothetical protein